MERRDAFTIADKLLIATGPDEVHRLRPPLTETLGMLNQPEHIHFDVPNRTVYLLGPGSLVVVTVQASPLHVSVERIDLTDVRITRACHDIEQSHTGVWWKTTWTVTNEHANVSLVGRDGPQGADDVEMFGRAVAQTAEWPIDSSPSID
jgi:hypothetical protein